MANSREEESFYGKSGWRSQPMLRSLSEVHRTLVVPHPARFYRKLLAFAGPGFLVAVGYMYPGNWATDLSGGSKFNYTLLSVIMITKCMAILLQSLSQQRAIDTCGHRTQDRRDHDATQSLSAFLDRADAQLRTQSARQTGSDQVRDDRLDVRAHVRSLHQCRDSDCFGGDVLSQRPQRGCRDRRCLQTSLAATRCHRREYSLRDRAAGFRPKFYAHRHSRWPDRDGRIYQHSSKTVTMPVDHPLDCHP